MIKYKNINYDNSTQALLASRLDAATEALEELFQIIPGYSVRELGEIAEIYDKAGLWPIREENFNPENATPLWRQLVYMGQLLDNIKQLVCAADEINTFEMRK